MSNTKCRISGTSEVRYFDDLVDEHGSYLKYFILGITGGSEGEPYLDVDGSGEQVWVCDAETFNRWQNVVKKQAALRKRIYGLQCKYGADVVRDVILTVQSVRKQGLDGMTIATNAALDSAFGNDEEA